jgi:hypothetical protein
MNGQIIPEKVIQIHKIKNYRMNLLPYHFSHVPALLPFKKKIIPDESIIPDFIIKKEISNHLHTLDTLHERVLKTNSNG